MVETFPKKQKKKHKIPTDPLRADGSERGDCYMTIEKLNEITLRVLRENVELLIEDGSEKRNLSLGTILLNEILSSNLALQEEEFNNEVTNHAQSIQ